MAHTLLRPPSYEGLLEERTILHVEWVRRDHLPTKPESMFDTIPCPPPDMDLEPEE